MKGACFDRDAKPLMNRSPTSRARPDVKVLCFGENVHSLTIIIKGRGTTMRLRILAAILVASFAIAARAQEFAVIGQPVSESVDTEDASPLTVLANTYFQQSYADFEKKAENVLTHSDVFDFTSNWYLLVFKATPPNAKDPVLVMTVCHAGLEHPTTTLPGVHTFKEVFLDERQDASLGRVYLVTEEVNPLQADIIKFAQQVNLGAIAARANLLSATFVSGKRRPPVPNPKGKLFFVVSDVTVPFQRSTIVGKAAMTAPDISVDKLHQKANDLHGEIVVRKGRISDCATFLAGDLAAVVNSVPSNTAPVTDSQREQLGKDLETQTGKTLKTATCTDEIMPNVPERAAKNAAVTDVQDAFQALAAGSDPKRIEGDVTLHNTPRRLLSFGAIAGGMFAIHGDQAKVDSGKITADPLSGGITLAAVNISLRRFDPTTVSATSPEKVRAFVGYVVTPEPGIGAGLSYLFFRGFSINAGAAQMLILTPKKKDDIGKDVTGVHPLKHGWGRAMFVGFGFNF